MGFFTVFDGDIGRYLQDFADKTTFVFDLSFHMSLARRRLQ